MFKGDKTKSTKLFYTLMFAVGAVAISFTLFYDQPSQEDKSITIQSNPNEGGGITISSNQALASEEELSLNGSTGHISGVLKGPVIVNITQLP